MIRLVEDVLRLLLHLLNPLLWIEVIKMYREKEFPPLKPPMTKYHDKDKET